MGDKKSTLVLDVDLDCRLCNKKIRKVLCKFPEIQSQSFDEKQKKVTISGPFDPEKLIKKLYCKAGCKTIKGYVIPKPLPPKPPPPPAEPPKPPPPPPPPPSEPTKPPPPPSEPVAKAAPPQPEPQKPKPAPPCLPEFLAHGPVNIHIGPVGPPCCCRPCYEGHERDGICTRGGGHYDSSYRFFCEEEPMCKTM
ncbi:protein PYRICULARIA ORYZAE RESISTANCE 21-like [Magnolia sinica]|uniref:protein PYRICULARIA ORYZAE RESISTANCE 21-like n=1 Tax=Magnolia sinica TaxID=86752 RepID=UPI00265B3831|nr:protein PYRICULARIA ORYZAE RESISTANCE 21-like [Magnolia sinica]